MKTTLRALFRSLVVCLAFLGTATSAFATHLRGTTISWSPTSTPGQVQFTIQYSQRQSFGGCSVSGCPVGSTLSVPFSFGDGQTGSFNTTITSVNTAEDYLSSTGTLLHTYTGAGPYTAFYDVCCRVSTVKSGHDQTMHMQTTVSPLASPANHSPVVSEPAIITLPLQNTTGFAISASDLDRDTLSYRMATASEMYNTSAFSCALGQPPGLSVNATTGQVTWDTTQITKAGCGYAAPVSGDLWTVQFEISDLDAQGHVKSTVPLDIILKFVSSTEAPPTITLSTPGPITVQAGTPITFTATGNDVAVNSRVTLNATGLPLGATSSTLNQELAPPVTSTFNWTPTAAQVGSYVITYSATNDTFEQVLASITIYVQNIEPPVLSCSAPLSEFVGSTFSIPLTLSDPQADAVTVTWSLDGTVVQTDHVAASNGNSTVSLSENFSTPGTHTVLVSATDTDNKTSTCSTMVTVAKADQTISFAPLANQTYGAADITLMGTASSGLPVSYTASGACTIVGGAVHITGAGMCSVTANQPGNASYNAAPAVVQSFTVAQAPQAITFNPPPTATYGTTPPITLASSGGASGNPVTYTVTGPATLSGNVLTITGAGNVVVTANQAGNANYSAAPAVARTIVVAQAAQAISFNPPATVVYGSGTVALSATGGASGNPVTYTATGGCTVSGTTLTITGAGNCVVTANQAGNANYSAATAVTKTIVVSQAPQAITFNPPATALVGQVITLNGIGGASGNPVTYTVTGPATLSGNKLTITAPGNVVVTANQAGNANYSAATAVTKTITVAKADQAITFNPPMTASVMSTIQLTGTGGASGNPVTYTVTGGCMVSGTTLTITAAGTCVVTANQAGNAAYNAAPAVVRSISTKLTATVTLSSSSTNFPYGQSANETACVKLVNGLAPTGTISIYDGSTLLTTQKVQGGGCIYYYIAPNPSVGSHVLMAYYNDANNTNVYSNPLTLTVTPGITTTEVDCWIHNAPYGGNIQCDANPDSGPNSGYMVYSYDNGPLVKVPMNAASHALFTIVKPAVGTHTVQISYPAQGNYGASLLPLQTFVISLDPINVTLTPSLWYTTAGKTVSLSAALTSYANVPPTSGTVSFFDGGHLIGTATVNASGVASFTSAALTAGTHSFTATYSGTSQYAAATGAATVSVGK